ncbi:DUF4258 domain-containing protein [Paenibacillus aestuarii]|uniref:DUF4258 domain-containing protein n=1 Tax=Paenibacillus aestuarii TaxID=516965 RepID=A0ABW0K7X3_9BACL
MDHMKNHWDQEMILIRKTVSEPEGIQFTSHVVLERMAERDISLIDIGFTFLTGRIYEGYDCGQYPRYRNPDPFRTVCGKSSKGELITVGIAFKSNGIIAVTTCYKGVPERLKQLFE